MWCQNLMKLSIPSKTTDPSLRTSCLLLLIIVILQAILSYHIIMKTQLLKHGRLFEFPNPNCM